MLKTQSKEKALIRDLQKTDTFNPFGEESKRIIHNLGSVRTLNYGKYLQKPNARLVPNIGRMGLCIAHVEMVYYPQKRQGW